MSWTDIEREFVLPAIEEKLQSWVNSRHEEQTGQTVGLLSDEEREAITLCAQIKELIGIYAADAMHVADAFGEFVDTLPRYPLDAKFRLMDAQLGFRILEETEAALRELTREDDHMAQMLVDARGPDVDLSAARESPDLDRVARDSLREDAPATDREIAEQAWGDNPDSVSENVRSSALDLPGDDAGDDVDDLLIPTPDFTNLDSRSSFRASTRWFGDRMIAACITPDNAGHRGSRARYPHLARLDPLVQRGIQTRNAIWHSINEIRLMIGMLRPPEMDRRPHDDE